MRSSCRWLVLAGLACVATGCANTPEPVAVELVAKGGPPVWTDFRIVPRTLELHHTELGWIARPLEASVDPRRLAGGLLESLGTVELPPGSYDQVRVGFVHVVDRQLDPSLPADASVVQDVAWLLRSFCLTERSADNRLRLDVFPAHPSADLAAPTFTLADAPECEPDTAEEP